MRRPPFLFLVVVTVLLSACSRAGDGGSDAVVTPGDGPADGTNVTVGAVQLDLPAQMQPLEGGDDSGDGITRGRYRSTDNDSTGRAAAVVVLVAATATRSATAEGEALVGYQKDVAKGTGIKSGPVDWPGFTGAYGMEFDDAAAQGGGAPLHHLVLVASTRQGGLVNVTVAAPPELFVSLDLKATVASVRPVHQGA
jgi:hypothetical protein